MSIRPALLVIADIGGYTAFMKAHKKSLAHAQDVVARLLEAVIDAAPNLTLLEIEGDAAFFYAWPQDGAGCGVRTDGGRPDHRHASRLPHGPAKYRDSECLPMRGMQGIAAISM